MDEGEVLSNSNQHYSKWYESQKQEEKKIVKNFQSPLIMLRKKFLETYEIFLKKMNTKLDE